MNQTETFTQTINTPISTKPLQGYITSLHPVSHDTNLAVVPCTNPFAICQQPLTNATPQPVQWLWQHRLPLAGITLLDGDHGTGKTLLAHQIAASVSSGSPMPDGTPTIQGNVIIITPHTDPSTTQLQRLINLGADLSRIKILSFIHDPASTPHPSGNRPFSLPEDLPLLFDTIDQLDARLIILDPFIHILSHQRTCTTHHLNHLLADLNQRLIERRVACLLIRNCPAKGGHARPSALEHSDDFPIIAISRLILAPDPIDPDRILLSHALSRHAVLTPTLTLQIQPLPTNPDFAHFTIHGTHRLTSNHLLTQRPDTLHRLLLSQHLNTIIAHATEPVAAITLYAQSPHSSPFQIQRSLKDLLQTGQIHHPTHGFYTPTPTIAPELDAVAATTPTLTEAPELDAVAATTPTPTIAPELDVVAATTPTPTIAPELDAVAATTPTPTTPTKLNAPAATTPTLMEAPKLDAVAAIPPTPTTPTKLDAVAATTPTPTIVPKLDAVAATTPTLTEAPELDAVAAIPPTTPIAPKLDAVAAIPPTPTAPTKLDSPAAIPATPIAPTKLKVPATTTPNPRASRPHKHPFKQKKWHGRPGQSKKRS